jgi:hypothetical protein
VSNLPDVPERGPAPPERRLSPEQFELVIRRAAELQARSADDPSLEGVSPAELIRIGREIGLAPHHVQRALAETRVDAASPPTLKETVFGPGVAVAGRVVPGSADALRAELDRYLQEREWLTAIRRRTDRTTYRKARGLDLAKMISMFQDTVVGSRQPAVGAGFKLRNASQVELAVEPLDETSCYVGIRADLRNYRTGFATAGVVGGWGTASAVGAILAIAIEPAAALLALPVGGGAMYGFRAAQAHVVDHAQTHLESILDCLERGEPLVRTRARGIPRGLGDF